MVTCTGPGAVRVRPLPRRQRHRRLGLLLGGGFLILLAALILRICWFTLPRGKGPAGPPVPASLLATTWTTRPVLVLGLGDSITAGFGVAPGRSAFDRLVRTPPDDSPDIRGLCLETVLPDLRVRNLAVSSSTSADHLTILESQLEPQDPAVLGLVVLTTGGNDLIHSYGRSPPRDGAMYGATLEQARPWLVAMRGRLEGLVALLQERFPGGCHIFLADIYDPTDGAGHAIVTGMPRWPDSMAILDAANQAIRQVAAAHAEVHLVRIHSIFLGHGLHCTKPWNRHFRLEDPSHWFLENIEDPSDRGHDAIRRQFLLEMARVLGPPGD